MLELRDAEGRVVARSGVRIRASLVGSGARLEGQRDATTGDDGRARFTDLRISAEGTFRIRFESEGLEPVESNEIRVRKDDDD